MVLCIYPFRRSERREDPGDACKNRATKFYYDGQSCYGRCAEHHHPKPHQLITIKEITENEFLVRQVMDQ